MPREAEMHEKWKLGSIVLKEYFFFQLQIFSVGWLKGAGFPGWLAVHENRCHMFCYQV